MYFYNKSTFTLTFILLIIVFFPFVSISQNLPELKKNGKENWDKKEWRKANTARFSFYMCRQMRESIRLMNLARINGPKFSEIYVEPITDKTGYEESLIKMLNKSNAKTVLRPSVNMYGAASVHAFFSGIEGTEGHSGFNFRMFMVQLFNWGKETGENCDYGSKKALNIVMDLLIDRGVPDLGHRKNILNPDFNRIGGSRFLHTKYTWNAVYDFSSANWKDMLFHVKPDIQQFGLDLGVSQISDRPMADVGVAYFANHLRTSDLLLTLDYQKGFLKNKNDALSFYIGSGCNTNMMNNFLLGVKFQSYLNLSSNNLYIQPEVSWFTILSFFRKGYLYEMNDLKKSAIYRFTYGYNFRIMNGKSPDIYRHNFTISRFICIKSKVNKNRK